MRQRILLEFSRNALALRTLYKNALSVPESGRWILRALNERELPELHLNQTYERKDKNLQSTRVTNKWLHVKHFCELFSSQNI